MIKCCIGCTDRKLFCHSNCNKYIKDKALHEATKTLMRERKASTKSYEDYHAERVRKTKKK